MAPLTTVCPLNSLLLQSFIEYPRFFPVENLFLFGLLPQLNYTIFSTFNLDTPVLDDEQYHPLFRIRIRIRIPNRRTPKFVGLTDPDPSIKEQTNRENIDFYSFVTLNTGN